MAVIVSYSSQRIAIWDIKRAGTEPNKRPRVIYMPTNRHGNVYGDTIEL